MTQQKNVNLVGEVRKQPGQDQAGSADDAQVMNQESPRKCKVCGGPNHYGCGCEAKALREADADSNRFSNDEQPAQPAQPDELDRELTPEEKALAETMFKRMIGMGVEEAIATGNKFFETVEGICACLRDQVELLKTISLNVIATKAHIELHRGEHKPAKRKPKSKPKKRR